MGSHMRAFGGSWFRFAVCSSLASVLLAACGGEGTAPTSNVTAPPPSGQPSTPPTSEGPAAPTNQAPTIAGTAPATVEAGQAYKFTPTASDADQDTVTFTVANKPAWAVFAPATGELSGSPAEKDIGAYADIEIAATDGKTVTTLPPFTITVAAAGTAPAAGSAAVTLSWTPPTQNADGSALSDLAGYKIHYGTASQSYTEAISVDNPGLSRYVIDALPAGQIFLAMSAYNAAGAESELSSEVSVTLN